MKTMTDAITPLAGDDLPIDDPLCRLIEELDAADLALGEALAEDAEAPATYAERRGHLNSLSDARLQAASAVAQAVLEVHRSARTTEAAVESAKPRPPAGPAGVEAAPDDTGSVVTAEPRCATVVTSDPLPPLTPAPMGLSSEDLAMRLRQIDDASATPRSDASPQRDVDLVRTLLHHAGRPSEDPADDTPALVAASAPENYPRWDRLTPAGQQRWLRYLVAWYLAAQEREPENMTLRRAFSNLRAYSKTREPGLVHGFALAHLPVSASWLVDARTLAEEIRPAPRPRAASGTVTIVGREDATSADADDMEDGGEDNVGPGPPETWPCWDRVRGRRAVVFGGSPREERRGALERAFELKSLEWVESKKPRLAKSLSDRIRNGGVDLVLVTKFASHQEIEDLLDAAKTARAIGVMLHWGYGINKVQEGIEAALGGRRRQVG